MCLCLLGYGPAVIYGRVQASYGGLVGGVTRQTHPAPGRFAWLTSRLDG